ncbi:MAG TPA: Rap1a/Tai family immunity protein [Candidatus Binataceae bacterium]
MKTPTACAILATCVSAVCLLAIGLDAQAAQPISVRVRTAGDLAELCGVNTKDSAADAKINWCHGFAQGVVDLELQHTADKKPFCFPSPPPPRAKTLDEFVNWVRAMPDHRSLGATEGLFKFLAERFPCK